MNTQPANNTNVASTDRNREYRAELTDENGTTTIRTISLGDAQKKLDSLLNGTAHFEQQDVHMQFVRDRKGGAVVGWITEMQIPEVLSVKHQALRQPQLAEQAA